MIIEEIHIQNFKALKDVHLKNLPAMAVFVGENGSGKSTLFHVFPFLRDCLEHNVRIALQNEGGPRGFQEVITRGVPLTERIVIEVKFRLKIGFVTIQVTYRLEIGLEENKPVVMREVLSYPRAEGGEPFDFVDFSRGRGQVVNNEEAFTLQGADPEIEAQTVAPDALAISSLGQLGRFKAAKIIRELIAGWHVSDFQTAEARGRKIREEGTRLSSSGGNLASVAYRLQQEHPEVFRTILDKMRRRIPGIRDIAAEVGPDGGLYLRYSDSAFEGAFLDQNVSDGTIRMFAYLVLLLDPQPQPFLCVEEPENQLFPELMLLLAEEFQSYADRGGQVFVSTHSPQFLNAVELESLFLIRKTDGVPRIYRLQDDPLVSELIRGGDHPGYLWSQGVFAGLEHRVASGS
jgi:predicted ATPase